MTDSTRRLTFNVLALLSATSGLGQVFCSIGYQGVLCGVASELRPDDALPSASTVWMSSETHGTTAKLTIITRALIGLFLLFILADGGAIAQISSPDGIPRRLPNRGNSTYSAPRGALRKSASTLSIFKRKAEWQKIIDRCWGPGAPYVQKLSVFDTYASYIKANCPTFVYSRLNWDSVAGYWRSRITDSTSRGAFNAILMNLSYELNDLHAWAGDISVISTPMADTIPYVSIPWDSHDVRYFGACLTLLPDSSLLVYKVVPNHPLGLQPGDRVLGYEGVPWPRLADELIAGGVGPELQTEGAPSSVFYHRMVWAGMSWHLFDTIDIAKSGTGQVLHLPTASLALLSSTAPLLQTDQLPVPGVPMPTGIVLSSDVKWGIVAGTNVGYIYVYHHSDPKISIQFDAAVHALENTNGLIIDLRTDLGGKYGLQEGIARLVDFGDSTLISLRRYSAVDLYSLVPANTLEFRIPLDLGTVYRGPMAVLIGPNCVSYGDASAWQLRYVPNARFFGKTTMGAVSGRYWSNGPSVAGYYLTCPDLVLVDHRSPYTQLWAREFPVAENVWLTADGVAKGEEAVVNHALSWITTTAVPAGKPEHPVSYMLAQNFPNPFNPTTTIRYSLPHRSHVTLTVFNTLGQQVATLVNGDQDPGYHSVQFDGSGLASGVYVYRLTAGSFVQSRKMLVVTPCPYPKLATEPNLARNLNRIY